MEQSPWEANSPSDSEDVPRHLLNPKIYYGVHAPPPPANDPSLEPHESSLHLSKLFIYSPF
jgi:hypothetical protein